MKARHFFEVWQTVVSAVASVRSPFGLTANMQREIILSNVRERHGDGVAIEAVAYFDRLRADTTAHSAGDSTR